MDSQRSSSKWLLPLVRVSRSLPGKEMCQVCHGMPGVSLKQLHAICSIQAAKELFAQCVWNFHKNRADWKGGDRFSAFMVNVFAFVHMVIVGAPKLIQTFFFIIYTCLPVWNNFAHFPRKELSLGDLPRFQHEIVAQTMRKICWTSHFTQARHSAMHVRIGYLLFGPFSLLLCPFLAVSLRSRLSGRMHQDRLETGRKAFVPI